jgi:NAD+ kinase
VTPAAPHSAFNRSLFLTATNDLSLEVLPASGRLAVEVDGEVTAEVAPGDIVDVELLPGAGRIVRLGRSTFYDRARRKLRLLGSPEIDE